MFKVRIAVNGGNWMELCEESSFDKASKIASAIKEKLSGLGFSVGVRVTADVSF